MRHTPAKTDVLAAVSLPYIRPGFVLYNPSAIPSAAIHSRRIDCHDILSRRFSLPWLQQAQVQSFRIAIPTWTRYSLASQHCHCMYTY